MSFQLIDCSGKPRQGKYICAFISLSITVNFLLAATFFASEKMNNLCFYKQTLQLMYASIVTYIFGQ